MILLTDRFIDGTCIVTKLEDWEEGLELQEAAKNIPRILKSTLRDLNSSRYRAVSFLRPGLTNFLRGKSPDVREYIPHRTVFR